MDKNTTSIRDVIESIAAKAPGGPVARTVDTLKTGDPEQPVTGIVVTFMATCAVLDRAVKLGANLVITHEPTFYSHDDATGWLESDAVYAAKRAFIDDHGIAVWRFHDGPHRLKPDGIVSGMIRRLGWESAIDAGIQNVYTLKPQTVAELAGWCKERLGIPVVKVAGNPDQICSRVGLRVGACGGRLQIELFQKGDIDVLVCGESPEWETCEYVRDATAMGMNKSLIVLGHAQSEEAGMEWLVKWMRPLVPPQVLIAYVQAGGPFRFV